MKQLSILIAAQNASEYPALLQNRISDLHSITIASSKQEASEKYNNHSVLLARPDYVTSILDTNPPIEWIQSTWAGVTPYTEHKFQDYKLTGVKDVFGEQMSEYVIGYILQHELRMQERADQQQHKIWEVIGSGRLHGKTMGIMGTGSIGKDLARLSAKLGVDVIGYNSSGKTADEFTEIYTPQTFKEFLRRCDYVVSILPDLSTTTNLMNADAFVEMKETALFINVGRGNVVDEAALCNALESNSIAGAVLDVFKTEPLPESSRLWTTKNLIITPHVAAMSYPKDIVEVFIRNLERYLAGEPMLYQVDFNKGY